METHKPDPGRVAVSKAGRDAGKFFIVYAVLDGQYVLIADGKYHKTAKPKKKKLKHLRLTDDVIESIGAKLVKGSKVFDSEIHSALKKYNNTGESGNV